ncbi:MAG TPA: phytanoyl-CoA dioxygenase family protein [Caulobacteraceae bacterium]|jgi:ectoine hydroxylase-related dioxygenase (phytanoyl-CoA dioxygenase family)|nr:phytanoyl-CoA dioxygenase family protein [Caulobacteraceae bacterium]
MDDAPARPRPPRAFESAPYFDQKRRVTQLYPELKRLGLETHIADLVVQGYTVVPPEKVAPPEYIAALRDAVLGVSERRTGVRPDAATGATHQGSLHPLGQFMRYVLFEDPVFEPVLTNPVLLGLITYLVGYDALLSLNDAMVKGPGGAVLPLHTDNGDLMTPVYPDQPQTANINLLLNDYEAGSGTIAFLPGSHRFRRQPTAGELRELKDEMVPIIAPAGSAVIWPANTWHMAFSRSDPGLRLTLLYDFCRGHLQTQSPFRADVADEVLARNPPRFAQLMHVYGAFPFRAEDIDRQRPAPGAQRHSLFDCHPLWKPFFGLEA